MDRRAYRQAGNVEREAGRSERLSRGQADVDPGDHPNKGRCQGTGLHSKQWPIRRSTLARLPEQTADRPRLVTVRWFLVMMTRAATQTELERPERARRRP
jgi:hypothetical protein